MEELCFDASSARSARTACVSVGHPEDRRSAAQGAHRRCQRAPPGAPSDVRPAGRGVDPLLMLLRQLGGQRDLLVPASAIAQLRRCAVRWVGVAGRSAGMQACRVAGRQAVIRSKVSYSLCRVGSRFLVGSSFLCTRARETSRFTDSDSRKQIASR